MKSGLLKKMADTELELMQQAYIDDLNLGLKECGIKVDMSWINLVSIVWEGNR